MSNINERVKKAQIATIWMKGLIKTYGLILKLVWQIQLSVWQLMLLYSTEL